MKWQRVGSLAGLAVSFAAYLALAIVLTGRLSAPGLVAALCAGALGAALIFAARPLRVLRTMPPRVLALAAGGGVLAFFGAPAMMAAVRMSDAPAGSVVVFWVAGGWAALVGLLVAANALNRATFSSPRAILGVAAAAASIAGAAGVVANWERPSSFSPWVTFPSQQMAIVLAGVLFVAGGMAVARASRDGRARGALLTAAIAAAIAAVAWLVVSGPADGLASIAELPEPVVLASVAWGVTCILWVRSLAVEGPAVSVAPLVLAPILISALTWAEQATAVAGPQPFVFGGLAAGAVLCVTAAAAFLLLGAARDEVAPEPRRWALGVSMAAVATGAVALLLPAINVYVRVTGTASGTFSSSWTLPGAESVAGWAALALALLLAAAAFARRPMLLSLAGLASCAAWYLLLDVPTHVLTSWLAPEIQSYYGTPYGSITFAPLLNVPMVLAVGLAALGFAALIARSAFVRRASEKSGTVPNAPEE